MKNHILIFCLFIFLLPTIYSQDKPDQGAMKRSALNGHTFPSLNIGHSSFINTNLLANLGVGSTGVLKIPGIMIDDYEILSFEGKILFMELDVMYQQRFTPWLAMFMTYTVAGRLGTDMSTILADGINTIKGSTIGWKVRLAKSTKLNMSGTIAVVNLSGNFINISDYFRDLINNVPDPAILKTVPALALGTGLQAAYAFNSMYGLQFHANYSYGESFVRGEKEGYFSTGIMGDLDFYPQKQVPIGLAIGFGLSSNPAVVMGEGGTSNIFKGKVYYSASNDFELALQYSYYNIRLSNIDDKPYVSKIMLGLNFFF